MRIAVLTVVVLVFVATSAEAQQIDIEVSLPGVAGLFGLGPKIDVVVTNATPFHGENVIAFGTNLGELPPGGSLHDRWSFDFDYTEIPVVIRFYDWADDGGHGFVGVAAKVLPVHRGQPTSWVVQTSDVKRPDDRYASYGYGRSPYPAPDVGNGIREVDFPRIGFKSTTAFQFVNVNFFDGQVIINGREEGGLSGPGDVISLSYSNKYNRSLPVKIEVVFTDRGRLVGFYETTASVGTNPRAIQYVFTPDKIRRY